MPDRQRRKLIGDILLKAGMIYEQQLLAALKEQKFTNMRFGEVLVKNGWISDKELVQALSEQLSIPMVDLQNSEPDEKALKLVPQSMAERLQILPVNVPEEGQLKIATSEPTDLLSIDEVHQYTGHDIILVLAPSSKIRNEISRFYKFGSQQREKEKIQVQSVLIGSILFNDGVISETQIQAVLEEQKQSGLRFGEILLKNGWVTEPQLIQALSVQLNIPIASTGDYPPDEKALGLVPQKVSERLQCLPLKVTHERVLKIAVSEPLNVLSADELRELTDHRLEVFIGMPSELRKAIPDYYRSVDVSASGEIFKQTLLGQVLVNAGMIDEDQLDTVLQEQKEMNCRIGEILINKGWLDEQQLTEGISRQMRVPAVMISSYNPDSKVLQLIPKKIAEKYQILPLKQQEDGVLLVATAEPLLHEKVVELEMISHRQIEFRIARSSSLKKEIQRFYSSVIYLEE